MKLGKLQNNMNWIRKNCLLVLNNVLKNVELIFIWVEKLD